MVSDVIREALALHHSMVMGGERPSEQSEAVFRAAMDELKRDPMAMLEDLAARDLFPKLEFGGGGKWHCWLWVGTPLLWRGGEGHPTPEAAIEAAFKLAQEMEGEGG